MRVGPLADDEIDTMVAACLATPNPPAGLAGFVRAHGDGTPFLVEELLAGLVATGALAHEDGRWVRRGELTPRVPASLRESIGRRLGLLDATARRVTGAAALLGRRFDWERGVLPHDRGAARPVRACSPSGCLLDRRESVLCVDRTPITAASSGGARVSSPARTVFDLGRRRPVVDAVTGVDALRRACAVDLDEVRSVARRHLGARGIGQLPQVLRRSTHLADSPMESRIRVAIEDAGLPLPVLQHRVGPYLLDLAYPDLKIAVEYDGREHLTPARARRDLRRQAYLTAAGWTVLRFPASVVLYEPWKIAADVGWLLRRR